MSLSVIALLGLAAATLYQKRYCAQVPFRSGSVIQLAAAAAATGLAAFAFETGRIEWSGAFIFALAWLVLVLSLGAFMLLYIIIRRGTAARVSSLFFLVPPSTAVLARFLFGERVGPVALAHGVRGRRRRPGQPAALSYSGAALPEAAAWRARMSSGQCDLM